MTGIGKMADDTAQAILESRAQALARPRRSTEPAGAVQELLEFRLGQDRYALESRHAGEVVTLNGLTPVPCTPGFVRGIVNVRGRITTVIELRAFYRLPEGSGEPGQVLVVRGKGMEFGILVSSIEGLGTVPSAHIQPVPATSGSARHLKGITHDGLLVLDIDAMLADPALLVHDTMESNP